MESIKEDEVIGFWNMVYNISLNMLHNAADAEDATQQIFEKVIKNISRFEKRSKFSTWVYRIAYNHLLDIKRKSFTEEISFQQVENDVRNFRPYENELNLTAVEEKIYIQQIKNGCTLAMLQCLDSESRLIFIIGNIFNLQGKEAAEVCNLNEISYRKKLSRAKQKIKNFMEKSCGLLNKDAHCKCRKRLLIANEHGRIDVDKLLYRNDNDKIREYVDEMNSIDAVSRVYQDNFFHDKRELFISRMKDEFEILRENNYNLFN